MPRNDFKAPIRPVRSSWKESMFLMKGPLTDKQIEKYAAKGYYSEEYRSARRQLIEHKKQKQQEREGNFLLQEGRMIYAPRN